MKTDETPEQPATAKTQPIVLCVGYQIRFAEDDQQYTIRAASRRYGICTRTFVEQDREHFEYDGDYTPPVYTIIDWDNMVRGRHDLVLNPFKFDTDYGCLECLAALETGECELSGRTGGTVPLVLSE